VVWWLSGQMDRNEVVWVRLGAAGKQYQSSSARDVLLYPFPFSFLCLHICMAIPYSIAMQMWHAEQANTKCEVSAVNPTIRLHTFC
jgi:hypothetical protein